MAHGGWRFPANPRRALKLGPMTARLLGDSGVACRDSGRLTGDGLLCTGAGVGGGAVCSAPPALFST